MVCGRQIKAQSFNTSAKAKEDFGGEDINNKYCKNCAPEGRLMNREQITENISKEEAEKNVDETMAKMPAWKR